MIQNDSSADSYLQRMEESRQLNLRCASLLSLFKAGEMEHLKPLWILNPELIDFSNQPDQLIDELLVDGYTLVERVDIESLVNSFERGNALFLRDKKLTNSHGFADRKICRVLEHWNNEERLIPPTILFNHSLGLNFAQDGKHRLKVAYYYGVAEILIIIPNVHLAQVMRNIQL